MTENTVCVTTKTVQKAIERYVAERCVEHFTRAFHNSRHRSFHGCRGISGAGGGELACQVRIDRDCSWRAQRAVSPPTRTP